MTRRVSVDPTWLIVDATPSFEAWESSADEEQRADPLWRMAAYRIAVYALEVGWNDARDLDGIRITRPVAAQLYRALASIAANIAEGYSRSSGADRVRFFEYALGSARESTVWYRAARPVLGSTVVTNRIATLTRIRQLLLVAIPRERPRRLRPRDP
jgi:four helix bundle protein